MDTRFTKRYYNIGEASDIIGVPQSTLRFWEKEFLELRPRRSAGNRRYYSPSDMELLEIIYYILYTKGMKIEIAREHLRHNRKNVSKKLKIIEKLKEVREELEFILNSLNLRGDKLGITENKN